MKYDLFWTNTMPKIINSCEGNIKILNDILYKMLIKFDFIKILNCIKLYLYCTNIIIMCET